MVGHPKYKVGDIVKFKFGDGSKEGVVAIVDRYGTFFDDSDVSYDIMVKEERMLYKHVKETLVDEFVRFSDPNKVWEVM